MTMPPTRVPHHHRQRLPPTTHYHHGPPTQRQQRTSTIMKGDGVCRRQHGNVPHRPDGDDACHRHRLHMQVSPYIPLPLLPFTLNAGASSPWVMWQPYHQHAPTATTTTSTTTSTSMIAATTTTISTSMTTDCPHTKTTAHEWKQPPVRV